MSRLIRWEGETYLLDSMSYRLPITPASFMQHYWQDRGTEKISLRATVEDLKQEDCSHQLIVYYLSLLQTFYGSGTTSLCNESGECIVPTHVQFKSHLARAETITQLFSMIGVEHNEDIHRRLTVSNNTVSGELMTITLVWVEQRSNTTRVMGWIHLTDHQLILETETIEQSEQGIALIEKYLGDHVSMKKRSSMTYPLLLTVHSS